MINLNQFNQIILNIKDPHAKLLLAKPNFYLSSAVANMALQPESKVVCPGFYLGAASKDGPGYRTCSSSEGSSGAPAFYYPVTIGQFEGICWGGRSGCNASAFIPTYSEEFVRCWNELKVHIK